MQQEATVGRAIHLWFCPWPITLITVMHCGSSLISARIPPNPDVLEITFEEEAGGLARNPIQFRNCRTSKGSLKCSHHSPPDNPFHCNPSCALIRISPLCHLDLKNDMVEKSRFGCRGAHLVLRRLQGCTQVKAQM